MMRTYNRNGIHIEQCDQCRGIFLDYGELETLSRVEAQWAGGPVPPGAHAPAWGAHGSHGHHRSFGRMLFSS
jgi:Zn-finger nucleic acid-binding protein